MNKRDLWIDETMKALEGIGRTAPSSLSEEQILMQWRTRNVPVSWLRSPLVWQAAAAVLVLLVLNFYTGFTAFIPVSGGQEAEAVTATLDYLTPINF